MAKPNLTQYLESLPARGGEQEQLRQERILQSIDGLAKSIREEQLCELRSLAKLQNPTLEEQRMLDFLRQKFPEEGTDSAR